MVVRRRQRGYDLLDALGLPIVGAGRFTRGLADLDEDYQDELVAMAARYTDPHSPPEAVFFTEVCLRQYSVLLNLLPQYEVGPYRLDFALPDVLIGIEIDGLAWHNGQEAFARDRARERMFLHAGWRIMRFAAIEINRDVTTCAEEANYLVAKWLMEISGEFVR